MSQKDLIRAWKRDNRIITIYSEEYPFFEKEMTFCPGSREVHAPNKNESKKIRQLMSIKGLKESELRKYKKFRKELSESQKNKGTKSQEDRVYLKMRKKLLKHLNYQKNI